jgi:hypothetical protein
LIDLFLILGHVYLLLGEEGLETVDALLLLCIAGLVEKL